MSRWTSIVTLAAAALAFLAFDASAGLVRAQALARDTAAQGIRAKVLPITDKTFRQTGRASWYGGPRQSHRTASGERFDQTAMTAAHRSLPFDSWVRVTNLENHRIVVVRINDRGPYVKGRVIDVSASAAQALGMKQRGTARVRIDTIPMQVSSLEEVADAR
jgi:rare lipoprotein A (peptidoglycan hydrolase)